MPPSKKSKAEDLTSSEHWKALSVRHFEGWESVRNLVLRRIVEMAETGPFDVDELDRLTLILERAILGERTATEMKYRSLQIALAEVAAAGFSLSGFHDPSLPFE